MYLQKFYVTIKDKEVKLVDYKFTKDNAPIQEGCPLINREEIGWICVGKNLVPSDIQPSKLLSSGRYYYREISEKELMELVGHPIFLRLEQSGDVKKVLYKVLIHKWYD